MSELLTVYLTGAAACFATLACDPNRKKWWGWCATASLVFPVMLAIGAYKRLRDP